MVPNGHEALSLGVATTIRRDLRPELSPVWTCRTVRIRVSSRKVKTKFTGDVIEWHI